MTAAITSRCNNLTADQSAAILTGKIRRKEPFFFVRYGDGAIDCVLGKHGMTRDMELYTPQLAHELSFAWQALMRGENVYVGDWRSASFDARSEYSRYTNEYNALIGDAQPEFLHFESLLLMRDSQSLVDFYTAVKMDRRKKLYMGPAQNAPGARMMGAKHIVTPMRNLFAHVEELTAALDREDFDVLLYGAGMAGNIPAVRSWVKHPERTYVALGSALDPLGLGKTRYQQLDRNSAKRMLYALLDPKDK